MKYGALKAAIGHALAAPTVQEPEIVQRVKRYAGQTMRTARNPNITARECIELANWIAANTTTPPAQPAPVQPVACSESINKALMDAAPLLYQGGYKAESAACNAALLTLMAAQPAPTVQDDYKTAYIEAMVAPNEAGFAGMSAAETIRELDRMVSAQPAPVQEPVAWVPIITWRWNNEQGYWEGRTITPPAAPIPDAITDNSESPDFRAGWNECRELAIQMRKP